MPHRTAVNDWFVVPEPKMSIKSIGTGVLVFIVGIMITGLYAPLGLLAMLVGVGYAALHPFKPEYERGLNSDRSDDYSAVFSLAKLGDAKAKYASRPTTMQMLEWLRVDCDAFSSLAMEALDMEEDEIKRSEVLRGPIYWEVAGMSENDSRWRRWSREGYLYACWRIVVLHVTHNRIGIFECDYDWLKNSHVNPDDQVSLFKHVVTVGTHTDSSSGNLEFRVSFTNGKEIAAILNSSNLNVAGAASAEEEGHAFSHVVRTMLRDFSDDA